jgi:hypothetical protein
MADHVHRTVVRIQPVNRETEPEFRLAMLIAARYPMDRKDSQMLIAACPDPECGAPAEIVPWAVADSTNGPVPHVRTLCVNKHRYLLPDTWIPSCDTRPDTAREFSGKDRFRRLHARGTGAEQDR